MTRYGALLLVLLSACSADQARETDASVEDARLRRNAAGDDSHSGDVGDDVSADPGDGVSANDAAEAPDTVLTDGPMASDRPLLDPVIADHSVADADDDTLDAPKEFGGDRDEVTVSDSEMDLTVDSEPDAEPDPCELPEVACVHEGDLLINTAFQARAFEETGCGGIDGDLFIEGWDTLTNLDRFANLRYVTGTIWFYFAGDVTDISGLSNLTVIGRDLSMGIAPPLHPTALPRQSDPGPFSEIHLDGLRCVGRHLQIVNYNARELSFNSLSFIGEDLIVVGDGGGHFGTALFPLITKISGDISIGGDGFHSMDGLANLVEVGGDLELGGRWAGVIDGIGFDAAALQSVEGLAQLRVVGGTLIIQEAHFLTSIGGQYGGLNDSLESIGGLSITNNRTLAACEVRYLRDRLHAVGAIGEGGMGVSNNDEEAVCDYYP